MTYEIIAQKIPKKIQIFVRVINIKKTEVEEKTRVRTRIRNIVGQVHV